MIAFASLFLGLVVGLNPVEVVVGPEVARVELFLDGGMVDSRSAPPWRMACDFGPELRPRRLEARAFDRQGKALGHAVQDINLPHPPAEVTVALEAESGGRGAVASLHWQSIVATDPLAVRVSFDGRPLPSPDPRRIELPDHDPGAPHFLRAELDFAGNLTAAGEIVFGGGYGEQVQTQLTAVPVALAEGFRAVPPAALDDALRRGGRALPVVAVEEGVAEAVFVPALAAAAELARLESVRRRLAAHYPGHRTALGRDQWLRIVWPFPERQDGRGAAYEVFPPIGPFTHADGGLPLIISRSQPPSQESQEQRLADAVAVAGLVARTRNRRRAVVLVTAADAPDQSLYDPDEVRRFLADLGVPLFVWSVDPRAAGGAWGEATDVSSLLRLERATRELSRLLDRQRILWVEGRHLPQEITLAPGVEAMRLVR